MWLRTPGQGDGSGAPDAVTPSPTLLTSQECQQDAAGAQLCSHSGALCDVTSDGHPAGSDGAGRAKQYTLPSASHPQRQGMSKLLPGSGSLTKAFLPGFYFVIPQGRTPPKTLRRLATARVRGTCWRST